MAIVTIKLLRLRQKLPNKNISPGRFVKLQIVRQVRLSDFSSLSFFRRTAVIKSLLRYFLFPSLLRLSFFAVQAMSKSLQVEFFMAHSVNKKGGEYSMTNMVYGIIDRAVRFCICFTVMAVSQDFYNLCSFFKHFQSPFIWATKSIALTFVPDCRNAPSGRQWVCHSHFLSSFAFRFVTLLFFRNVKPAANTDTNIPSSNKQLTIWDTWSRSCCFANGGLATIR